MQNRNSLFRNEKFVVGRIFRDVVKYFSGMGYIAIIPFVIRYSEKHFVLDTLVCLDAKLKHLTYVTVAEIDGIFSHT